MSTNELKIVLLWCTGINYVFLYIWFGIVLFAHDWVFRLTSRWFKLSVETFDAIGYGSIVLYKIGIVLLNLVPLIALYLLSWCHPA